MLIVGRRGSCGEAEHMDRESADRGGGRKLLAFFLRFPDNFM